MKLQSELIDFTEGVFRKNGSQKLRYAVMRFRYNAETFPWGTRVSEHRFNMRFVQEFEHHLDKIENSGLHGVIFTAEGKYFSNGMDTDFIRANQAEADRLQKRVEIIMSRILKLPMVTIAMINGHCTAAGAIFSLCSDYRLMTSHGLFFTPAVDLGIVYSQGMIEVVKAKISEPSLLRDVLLYSKRYSSKELKDLGIVSSVVESSERGLQECEDIIASHSKASPASLGEVRSRMYSKAIKELSSPNISSMWWSNISKL